MAHLSEDMDGVKHWIYTEKNRGVILILKIVEATQL